MLLIGVDSDVVAGIHAIAAVVEEVPPLEADLDMRRTMMAVVVNTPQALGDEEAAGEDLTILTVAITLDHLPAVVEVDSSTWSLHMTLTSRDKGNIK